MRSVAIALILCCNVAQAGIVGYGGVDFAMISGDKRKIEIPYFREDIDAINYANRVKWDEEILRMLKQELFELSLEEFDHDVGWAQQAWGFPNPYREQYERVGLAVYIIEKWKAKGVRGDEAMNGSFVSISSVPIKGGSNVHYNTY